MLEIIGLTLFNEIGRAMIWSLSFEIVSETKHNSFYALVMSNYKDQRQRKQKGNDETDTTMREQLTTT